MLPDTCAGYDDSVFPSNSPAGAQMLRVGGSREFTNCPGSGQLPCTSAGSHASGTVRAAMAACHGRAIKGAAVFLASLPDNTTAPVYLEHLLRRFRLGFVQPCLDAAVEAGGAGLHLRGLQFLRVGAVSEPNPMPHSGTSARGQTADCELGSIRPSMASVFGRPSSTGLMAGKRAVMMTSADSIHHEPAAENAASQDHVGLASECDTIAAAQDGCNSLLKHSGLADRSAAGAEAEGPLGGDPVVKDKSSLGWATSAHTSAHKRRSFDLTWIQVISVMCLAENRQTLSLWQS